MREIPVHPQQCVTKQSFFHILLTQNSTWSTKCYQSTLVIWTKDDVSIISFWNTSYPVIKSWKITCICRYEGTRFEWKIRILCEHLLIWQLFVQNNISYEIRAQYILSACSCICQNQFSGNVCLQHRILRFVNRTTVRQLLQIVHQLGVCDHEDASSETRKD